MNARRAITIAFFALVFVFSGFAQAGSDDPVEQARIAKAKKTSVSELEPGLPNATLEQYLKSEAGTNATIDWEMNDCGEQTGDPATTPDDFPICAQATVSRPGTNKVVVMVTVGTFKRGITGKPQVFDLAVIKPDGTVRPFSKLNEIADQLEGKTRNAPQAKPASKK